MALVRKRARRIVALRDPARAISGGQGSTVSIRKAVSKRSHFHG